MKRQKGSLLPDGPAVGSMSGPFADAGRSTVREGGGLVILRALPGLGDTLTALPAVRAIKRSRPDLSVTVVALDAAIPYWRRYPRYVDHVTAFPGWPGLPHRKPDIGRIPQFLAEMQAQRFELGVQLHGDGRIVNQIVTLFGSRRAAGHYLPADARPSAGTWLPWRDGVSDTRRGLRLMAALGFVDDDETLEFDIARGVVTQGGIVRALFPAIRHQEDRVPMALVHPGSSAPGRRWPADRWARVADGLSAMGMRVAITGSASERSVAQRLRVEMRSSAIDLTGRTSLDEFAEIMRRSSVVVSNESGVAHLAAALRTPSVVIFTDPEAARWTLGGRLQKPVSGSVEQVLFHARRMAARAGDEAA